LRWVGRRLPVLVCGPDEDGAWYGRTEGQAPEIDGVTWIAGDLTQARGRVVEMVISGADAQDLFAEPVA
jgi:ribosomal protein S12 methylthiotransferase